MAITEALPEIKAEVRVDKISLEEHRDDEDVTSPNTVTKYIEAKAGTEFTIHFELRKPWPETSLVLDVLIDGRWVAGKVMRQEYFEGTTPYTSAVEGVKYNDGKIWSLRKFYFSELTINESDGRCISDKLMESLKGVGDITIQAFRVKNIRPGSNRMEQVETSELGDIPEKSLKGRTLSHQLALRPLVSVEATSVSTVDYIDSPNKPFAVFNLRYRSRAALQSLLIIPRGPSSVLLEDRDINTLTPEESRELIRRLRERDEATLPIKREGIKRERSSPTTVRMEDYGDEVSFVSEKRRRLRATLDENIVEIVDLT